MGAPLLANGLQSAQRKPRSRLVISADARSLTGFIARGERPNNAVREMLEALPVAVYTTDDEGRLTYFNSAAVRLSGRTPELGTDKWCVTWKIFLPDGTPLPHDQCPMAVALRGVAVPTGIECIAERPDGSRFWFTPCPAAIRDSQGRIIGGVNLLLDITDRKDAEIEVNQQFRAIVDSSDDAIISKDLNGIITSWNTSAERLFGYSAAETVGRSITLLIPPDRLDEERDILARLRRGERVSHFETLRRRKDGSLINISLTISPVKNGQGVIIGASKIARDITEQKRAEAEQLRIQSELRRANEDLEQFAFSASHDLQEPLRNVKIYTELLLRSCAGSLDDETRMFAEYVRNGAARMEALLRDLLVYTQVAALDRLAAPADANDAFRAALSNLQTAVSASGAQITCDPLPQVSVHSLYLQQLFQNLLANAIKYRSPDRPPKIHVSSERRNRACLFSVEDNGIGIEPEYRTLVFGLFKRLHTAAQYGGTGLGLAICRKIVERYDGRIWVDSVPGEGSTFRFEIPFGALPATDLSPAR